MTRTSLVLLALLGASAPAPRAHAAEAAPGQLTKNPAVVAPVTPDYPPDARAQGATGQVTLEIEISDKGEVTDAVVTTPAGHGFDEAALAAARKLRFSPAEIDGKPAAVRIEYRFDFTLTPAEPAPSSASAATPAERPANLRGRVLEMGTRQPVVAALVQAGEKTAYTDRDGRFALSLPLGEVEVVVTDAAHARYAVKESILEGKATEVSYWVLRTSLSPNETVVTGKRERREVSHQTLAVGEIRRIAGVSGDTVKVVQNLPGVARPPFGSGQLVVRGGNPRDTRVYVDGLEVPEVFHFGGLSSIYSSELLQEVEFQAGNFGATSGRAIGGRVNLVTRDPGERTHAVADVNLYQATAFLEGRPSENLGLAVAARRSYADFMIQQAIKQMDDPPGLSVAPRYYDFQSKVAWKASADDKFRLDLFGSNDRMVLTNVRHDGLTNMKVIEYGNQFYKANLRYDRRLSDDSRLFLSAGGGWQQVTAEVGDYFTEKDDLWTTTFRGELHHRFGPALNLTVGADGQWIPEAAVKIKAGSLDMPGQISSGLDNLQSPNVYDDTISGVEGGVFVEAAYQPVRWLKLVPGVRADMHRSLETLSWVDPRLAVRAELDARTALKGGVGLYHQAPPIAYLTKEWGNPDLRPEGAWQYSVGVERKLFGQVSLDLELYYKRLFDLAQSSSGTVIRDGEEVAEHFRSSGTGKAYGAELLVRWDPDGRFFGWVAYSLSRSKRDNANSGETLQEEGSAYDQPHNVVAVGTVELPELWRGLSAGFRLRYTSGNPYERIERSIFDADGDEYQPIVTGVYNSREPDFFQLDLRVDKKWTYKLWSLSTYIEAQNVTNRKNVEAPSYDYRYAKRGWVTGIPFFPAFGVRAEY